VPRWLLAATALLLFVVWSNSFIAIGYLLGADGAGGTAGARFDWRELTAARFLPAAVIALGYGLLVRRTEMIRLVRAEWPRLIASGLLAVPGYNFALYFGQQHGIPAPIASLSTALAPLFILALSRIYLGERLTRRRTLGFLLALSGVIVISQAKPGGAVPYPAAGRDHRLRAAVLGDPLGAEQAGGGAPLAAAVDLCRDRRRHPAHAPAHPRSTWSHLRALDRPGTIALAFLSLACTVLGFALWSWLLRHLPASSVGLTVFLNPPLTTLFKYLLARHDPASFAFTIAGGEWLGGSLALAGLALAVSGGRPVLARGATPAAAPRPAARSAGAAHPDAGGGE